MRYLEDCIELLVHRGEALCALEHAVHVAPRFDRHTAVLSRFIWAKGFGASGVVPAPKLSRLYRDPRMSTFE